MRRGAGVTSVTSLAARAVRGGSVGRGVGRPGGRRLIRRDRIERQFQGLRVSHTGATGVGGVLRPAIVGHLRDRDEAPVVA
ncbi:MAG: hypothetical protein HY264_08395, partial [Chloroflexi bacterium]|nr:hypothetical protein [Chloroflexota bacterium]